MAEEITDPVEDPATDLVVVEPLPQPNPTHVAWLSDVAAACLSAVNAFRDTTVAASEGKEQGYFAAIRPEDVTGKLAVAGVRPTDAAKVAQAFGAINQLLDGPAGAGPGDSYRAAIQRLARAAR
jgi:hypothetical protein